MVLGEDLNTGNSLDVCKQGSWEQSDYFHLHVEVLTLSLEVGKLSPIGSKEAMIFNTTLLHVSLSRLQQENKQTNEKKCKTS